MPDPRHDLGLRAEGAVAEWLRTAGWTVLARRWRSPHGELDVICLDGSRTLVGVEVRARRTTRAGSAVESVDLRRVGRLRSALAAYAIASGVGHAGLRVDLVAVRPEGDRWRLTRIPALETW